MNLAESSKFLLAQRLTLLVNRYEYFVYDGDTKGELVAFAEQDRFAFRERVTVWTSESRSATLFTIQAEKLLDIHGKFFINDESGEKIGACEKVFGASLLRSTWNVYDAKGELICTARERSLAIALLRRIAKFIPLLDEVSNFIPFNFVLEKEGVAGSHTRVWGTLTDQYALTLGTALEKADRRIFLALGILLDALQDR